MPLRLRNSISFDIRLVKLQKEKDLLATELQVTIDELHKDMVGANQQWRIELARHKTDLEEKITRLDDNMDLLAVVQEVRRVSRHQALKFDWIIVLIIFLPFIAVSLNSFVQNYILKP